MQPVATGGIKSRPFPWRCARCGQNEVYPANVAHTTERWHDDSIYHLEFAALKSPKCRSCGELVFSLSVSDQIEDALRVKAGLLMPEEVRSRRIALRLTPEDLSRRIGYPEETVGKIEERFLIQTRALDNMLRLYFAFPNVREALNGGVPDRNLGLVELSTTEK
jgi:hypothetical protein